MADRRIESSASTTADITCGCRAVSFLETDPMYKSGDWVAPKLLPRKLQLLNRISLCRKLLSRILGPQGMYEWVVARTKYIDAVFMEASTMGFAQVLVFGAGFDSRGIRFQAEFKDAMIFELDAATTQSMKIAQYRQRGIPTPVNLTFVPVNFEKESFSEKLEQAGFCQGLKTLFILEGVLQYLTPEAVGATLAAIKKQAGKGSWLVFDYAHAEVLRGQAAQAGDNAMLERLSKYGESWQFGFEDAEVEYFVGQYGFKLLDRKGPKELEEAYFTGKDGIVRGRVNGTQSIAKAERL